MKVFRMNDFDLVAHYSEEQAKEFYHNYTGVPMDDIEEDFLTWGEVPLTNKMYLPAQEVPEEYQDEPLVTMSNEYYLVPFKWVLERFPDNYPGIIASGEG